MSTAGADDRALPRPAELEPAVAFWTQIYTEVPVDQGVIHDSDHDLVVYGDISVAPPPHWAERRQQVRRGLERYRDAFRALAAQQGLPDNALQEQIAARLPVNTQLSDYEAIADRLRFQGGLKERFYEGLVRSGQWRGHIQSVLAANGLPEELVALPHVESSFNALARSHAGAAGLWQFTSGTGREYMRVDPVVDERLDPWLSTQAAAQLLNDNYAQLNSWPLAITAYNHGRNGMRRAVRDVGTTDYVTIRNEYKGPRFGFASRNFYPSLLAAADVDQNAEQYFGPIPYADPIIPIRVTLEYYAPIEVLSAALGLPRAELQALNPGLGPSVWDGRKFAPSGYALALPADPQIDWVAAVDALPLSQVYQGQRPSMEHVIASGETLSGIADRYGVGIQALMAANGVSNANRIRAGQRLQLPTAGAMPVPVGAAMYVVRPGDTLGAIAAKHGVSSRDLAQLNALDNPNRLRVGQQLALVEGSTGP